MAKANSANGNAPSVTSSPPVQTQTPLATKGVGDHPVTIKLDEVIDVDGEGEEEVDTTELEEEEEEEGEEDVEDVGEIDGYAEIGSDDDDSSSYFEPASVEAAPRSRKRSSDELESVDDDESTEGKIVRYPGRCGTPPKRARTDSEVELLIPKQGAPVTPSPSLRRMRKRSSEELEDRDEREVLASKRLKVIPAMSDGDALESPPPTSDSSLLSSTSAEDSGGITMTRVSQADLERLYVLGDD